MRKILRKCSLWFAVCLLFLSACAKENDAGTGKEEKYFFSEMESKIARNELLQEGGNVGWCHEVAYVSPFADDEELRELAKIIAGVSRDKEVDLSYATVYVNCYSDQILIAKLKDKPDENALYETLRKGVAAQREKADKDLMIFHSRLAAMSYLHQSESGEYYFLVREESFDEDCRNIVNTLQEINQINPLGKYGVEKVGYTYYFSEAGYVYVGFVGDRFSVYREKYAPENKIFEEKFITNGLAVDAIYRAMIYDFGQKEANLEEENIKCSCYVYQWGASFRLEFSWNEWNERLSMEKLADQTYAIYEKMRESMQEKDCEGLVEFHVSANAPSGTYNVEQDHVNCVFSFLEEYTKEEWSRKLQEGFKREFESEPV